MEQLTNLNQALTALTELDRDMAAAGPEAERWQAWVNRRQIAIRLIAGILGHEDWAALRQRAAASPDEAVRSLLQELDRQVEAIRDNNRQLLAQGAERLEGARRSWEQAQTAVRNFRDYQNTQDGPRRVDVTG